VVKQVTKQIIFQEAILISGIMCHTGCGATIEQIFSDLTDQKRQGLLPLDAEITIDAAPHGLGLHQIFVNIESSAESLTRPINHKKIFTSFIKRLTSAGFEVLQNDIQKHSNTNKYTNLINILINLLAVIAIFALSIIFPPSILLTICSTLITCCSTAFTSRQYLFNFYQNLRAGTLANMATPITLGWLFALFHTLYHAISMPISNSYTMLFMNFIMPVMLKDCPLGAHKWSCPPYP